MKALRKVLGAGTVAGAVAVGALVSGTGAAGALSTGGGAGSADDRVTLERLAPGDEKASVSALAALGVQPAGLVDTYRLIGTQENDNFLITRSNSGRFIVRSRARPITPISPPLGCRVDSTLQVSCNPGLIKSLLARMKRGRDRVAMKPFVRMPVLMVGGRGGDRLVAGNGNSVLRGKRGPDRLFGNGGRNLLGGGKGRDVITTGAKRNRVRGGPGHDICIDIRKGNNRFRGCESIRRR